MKYTKICMTITEWAIVFTDMGVQAINWDSIILNTIFTTFWTCLYTILTSDHKQSIPNKTKPVTIIFLKYADYNIV